MAKVHQKDCVKLGFTRAWWSSIPAIKTSTEFRFSIRPMVNASIL